MANNELKQHSEGEKEKHRSWQNLLHEIDSIDYRDFVEYFFLRQKSQNRNLSYQNTATKMGTSKSYLKLVIDKKRHMSIEKVGKFCDVFKLSDQERQIFLFLFLRDTCSDKLIKEIFKTTLYSFVKFAFRGYKSI